MQNNMTTDKAAHALGALEEALAAVCSVALKEMERDRLEYWGYEVSHAPDIENTDPREARIAKKLQGLELAVRILAAVADGETDIHVAGAVYLDPLELLRIQREDWFDEDVLFFTNCDACGGQLVSVGGGDSAPSSCAACADPDFGAEDPNERRQDTYGHIIRTLFHIARTKE